MQNKVSYVVIIILAFVCLVLSMRIGRDGGVLAQPGVPALEKVAEQAEEFSGGVTVSSEENISRARSTPFTSRVSLLPRTTSSSSSSASFTTTSTSSSRT